MNYAIGRRVSQSGAHVLPALTANAKQSERAVPVLCDHESQRLRASKTQVHDDTFEFSICF